MDLHPILTGIVVLFGIATVCVPISRRLGFGSVIGYLIAGFIVGSSGLGLLNDAKIVMHIGEIGVILLLFIIGLELNPKSLFAMRRQVFGTGLLQVALTSIALSAALYGLDILPLKASLVLGFVLSLSSTAFGLQILEEKNQLQTRFGRRAFAILLFQDLAVIPALAILPLLSSVQAGSTASPEHWTLQKIAIVFLSLLLLWVVGRKLLSPILRLAASSGMRELFTATTLILVVGLALLVEGLDLSMALGAFIAGLLLSDSEYRKEVLVDMEPFKGLFLGLLFMSVGMSLNVPYLLNSPGKLFLCTTVLVAIKGGVLWLSGRSSRLTNQGALSLAATLPQGGEFAFVLFPVAIAAGILNLEIVQLATMVVILSMFATPFLIFLAEKFGERLNKNTGRDFDQVETQSVQVIIAGFGRFGQATGRTLRSLQIPFTALELDYAQVEVVRKFGHKVYFGDASRVDLLEAAGAKNAKLIVIAIDDPEVSLKTVDAVQLHFPHLKIFVRARNRLHAFELIERDVFHYERELFKSSLSLTEFVLKELGFNDGSARAIIEQFERSDRALIERQAKVRSDERAIINESLEGAKELEETLRSDERIMSALPHL